MDSQKWGLIGVTAALLVSYNLTQPQLIALRNNSTHYPGTTNTREGYGPSLQWLDRLAQGRTGQDKTRVKLDFSVMSSLMVAGLASGFKSQVANLLWMKSDEYWHEGLFTRQVPLMEAVVTLDPQFIDAWSTAGWHWAYNIYADIPSNPDYKDKGPKVIRKAQEDAVFTGLDYLKRGSNMNPDKYRLWFEWGWTRAEKAGIYDEETLDHYKMARKQSDARLVEIGPKKEIGIDILGRTIGHLYESRPDVDKALAQYRDDLLANRTNDNPPKLIPITDEQHRMLDKNGEYWGRYSSKYTDIASIYNDGDAVTKAQIKKLIPDVETLVEAAKVRGQLADTKAGKDQPVGAYVSITARYLPAWKLMKAGNIKGAIDQMVGVMNADPKYHLQGLPILAKVYEVRGDTPQIVEAELKGVREEEKTSSQDIGLHFLAKLYQMAADKVDKEGDKKGALAFEKLAYRTWYRSRERNALDFYALRNSRIYEDKYNFPEPADIAKEIKESRKQGTPNAAPAKPEVPPSVSESF